MDIMVHHQVLDLHVTVRGGRGASAGSEYVFLSTCPNWTASRSPTILRELSPN